MIIVSKDGSGDYTSIQDAIDSVKDADRNPTIILVRMNEYRERVIVNKDNIRIVGEARDRTVITWSACAKDQDPEGRERGTFLSFTMLVTGRNVEVENLTIRNDAGDGRKVGQAMAVYAAGDRGVWRNCRLMAAQDTLFCGPVMPKVEKEILPRISHAECVESVGDSGITHGRQYFEDCWIQGDVDFIFGPYRCWFERCTLFMNERGGWYTAANTPEGQPHGLVFHRCTLTGACQVGGGYLGRPWRKHARTVFLECSMDEHVSPLGFTDWDAEQDETGFLMQILDVDDDRFLALPIVGDNDEYLDLCCFIDSIDNEALHARLVRCSKGKGAVKRIKKELRRQNLMPQWEWYRNRYYFWSAIEWAMQNGIELIG